MPARRPEMHARAIATAAATASALVAASPIGSPRTPANPSAVRAPHTQKPIASAAVAVSTYRPIHRPAIALVCPTVPTAATSLHRVGAALEAVEERRESVAGEQAAHVQAGRAAHRKLRIDQLDGTATPIGHRRYPGGSRRGRARAPSPALATVQLLEQLHLRHERRILAQAATRLP